MDLQLVFPLATLQTQLTACATPPSCPMHNTPGSFFARQRPDRTGQCTPKCFFQPLRAPHALASPHVDNAQGQFCLITARKLAWPSNPAYPIPSSLRSGNHCPTSTRWLGHWTTKAPAPRPCMRMVSFFSWCWTSSPSIQQCCQPKLSLVINAASVCLR